jgi:hypothetical protein
MLDKVVISISSRRTTMVVAGAEFAMSGRLEAVKGL